MNPVVLCEGSERTKVTLAAHRIGGDLVVHIYNDQGHIGAVAVADFDHEAGRASTSIITRLGHKDDILAGNTAYRLCKHLRKPVCAIAGVHLDGITEQEIADIKRNCELLVDSLIRHL